MEEFLFCRKVTTKSVGLIALLSVSQTMNTDSGQDNKVWATENLGDDDGRGWYQWEKSLSATKFIFCLISNSFSSHAGNKDL